MRLLHAADFGGVAPGGFIPMIVALARRVRARGDAFALVVPRVEGASWYPALRAAGAELHVVRDGFHAARVARAWRPDVAHVHFFGWETPVTLALWPTRCRIVWQAHSTSSRDGRVRRSPTAFAKYRFAGARAARFVAVSHAVADEIALRGAARARIVVIHNAIDAVRFRPPRAEERATARTALGLAADERAILFFGRDAVLKGADVLAAALAREPLRAQRGLAVVSVATPDDARAALARYARVVAVERAEDVVPLLWACDALAVPSRGEGFGLVLLEALSTGLPAAASDLGALREAAAGDPAVRFAPAGDAGALAHALSAALAAGRGDGARGGERLTPDDWAARVEALYADIGARNI